MSTRKMKESIVENKKIFVGLEDSKRTWKLNVRCDGMEVQEASMPTRLNALTAYLESRFPGCEVGLMYEAGFKGFGLYDALQRRGIHCVVIPPHLVTEPKVSKVKTDKRDARRLANMLESGDIPSTCFVPDKERREDRQISRTLVGIQKEVKATKNRIMKLFDFHGIDVPTDVQLWSKAGMSFLKQVELSQPLRISLDALLSLLGVLVQTEQGLRGHLRELTTKPRYAKTFAVVQSLPGIGWFTAIRLVLELGEDLSRFASSKQIASFAGLVCNEHSSGDTVRRGGITHVGNAFIRTWLVECAWIAIRKDPVLGNKFRRVWSSAHRKKTAIVAVARMMLVRLRACVIAGTSYRLCVAQ
jgi:transposase